MNSDHCYSATLPGTNRESSIGESELVLAAKAGCHAAFGELLRAYSHRLYVRILSITRNPEDAEDALQDTFLRAYRALTSFEGRSQFSSWLTRIAINSALAILRRHRSRPEISFEQQPRQGDDFVSLDVPYDALNPEELCDQRQRSRKILYAIERLDPKLRLPLHIRISQEHSINEIAQALGISLASAKSRLYRARKRLMQSPALRNRKMEMEAFRPVKSH